MMHAATSRADKAEKPRIPKINWSANNSATIWTLLAKIEKSENYRVLYGKKDVAENTSGETKEGFIVPHRFLQDS
ncbi:uncharacterized protein LACBIDRAFT_296617 [Laccaria bicolor S238N-H82]|uniref:Predicted protein n=1 Tax=Laccaria bicolor (strain S238N-H82 / ATCC MYA-4686) TaxID=486041 RepID=B0D995_LACBS|nr:uncharacterized protein LACBIDRAFT_296617 [Laccaria bicolor S238N-H82]EDR09211.1 predicted protein [Laccaria bicolor S238N-H82]|eukprot:XP_001880524.1 predicted protein [Laccaria bicolor S238N-H82]